MCCEYMHNHIIDQPPQLPGTFRSMTQLRSQVKKGNVLLHVKGTSSYDKAGSTLSCVLCWGSDCKYERQVHHTARHSDFVNGKIHTTGCKHS